MLGRHPEVAMLLEDEGDGITKLAGKKYSANKLVLPTTIELNNRLSLWDRLLFRSGITYYLRRNGWFAGYHPGRLHTLNDY
ncbi:MAG: hypothetical protein AAF135_25360, partial [Bacteroidota bacterium]